MLLKFLKMCRHCSATSMLLNLRQYSPTSVQHNIHRLNTMLITGQD